MTNVKTIKTIKSGIWRHYKGDYYLVLGLAQHTERDEELVIYVPLTGNENRRGLRLRARPVIGAKGFIMPEDVGGNVVDRFEFVGEEMPSKNKRALLEEVIEREEVEVIDAGYETRKATVPHTVDAFDQWWDKFTYRLRSRKVN